MGRALGVLLVLSSLAALTLLLVSKLG